MRTGRYSADVGEENHSSSRSSTIASHGMFRKLAAGVLAVATMFGGMALGSTTASAATSSRDSYTDTLGNADFEAARSKYGLTKDMKNGAILHAWMWSFNTIKNNMKAIAEAGYTSVQTEPMSAIKTNLANGKKFTENWYYVYQPTDTTIGNFVVGSEQDLKDMCAEAHKYGVRIIVDVVANHFTSDWNAIGSDWKDTSLFHSRTNCPGKNGDEINYGNRWQVTHCHLLGLWDINTENQTAANKMKDFLVQAVNDGVDGFRFDAAKHVELPDEFPQHSVYWETILKNGAQYQYGEVLQGDNGLNYTGYTNMFTRYSSDGGGATASDYGKTVRAAISSSSLNAGNLSSLRNGGAKDDQLVTWVESHDNYANGDKESTYLNDYQLRMGWAIVGSRAGGAPLYFNRPVGSGGNNPQFAEQSQLGDAGDNMWKDKAVVAVNHFRNKMNGNSEYLRNCQGQNSCLMVERYAKDGNADDDGVVIANMGGDVNLAGSDTKLDDGTYTDQVNGGTLTVSGGKITAGTAKGGAVSAFYDMKTNVASVSATGNASFKTDTTTVTLHAANVTGAKYTTSEGKSGSYNDGDVITVGANTAVGSAVTVTVSGTDADGKTVTATFTFQKKDPTAVTVVYAKKPSSWSSLDAYVYVDDPNAASLTQNAKWPGVAMTAADACGKNAGYDYMYEIPDNFEGTVRVIFNDGNATNTTKYPADSTTGEDAAGLRVTGTSAWNGDTSASTSGALKSVSCTTTTVKSVTINQSDFSLDVSNGAATKKLTATTDPAGAAVTWSSSDDSVASVASDGTVTAKKAGTATITAKAGTATSSVKVTVTGTAPVAKNRIYVTKPSGWSSVYIYMYPGSGSSAASNAKWPGVEMTAISGTDTCGQSGYYYDVPDSLAGNAKVIFSDNGSSSNRYPADMAPGMDYNGGTVNWTSGSTALSAVTCKAPDVPVSSVAVSGSGVSDGKLSLEKGKSAQLSAMVNPSDATNRTVTWSSSDASVASVTGTGYVSAVKAGTATITATAGGKSASVKVTVTDPSSSQRFSDVPSSALWYSDIEWLASAGITKGNADGTFRGGDKLSRQDMAVFLYRYAKLAGVGGASSYQPSASDYRRFSDVKKGSFASTEILWLASAGITKGNADGTFRGGDKLSRQDMAVFLYRYAKLAGVGGASSYQPSASDYRRFSDVKKGSFASTEILWLASAGITKGNADGTFRGGDKLSRQDMAVFLHRLDGKSSGADTPVSSLSISGSGVSNGKLGL